MTKTQEELFAKVQRWKEDGFNDLQKFTKSVMDINNYPYEVPDAYSLERYLQALNYVLMWKENFWKEFENERKKTESNSRKRGK